MNSKTITLRIDRDLFDAIHKMSTEQERSYTWTINNLLRRQLATMATDHEATMAALDTFKREN